MNTMVKWVKGGMKNMMWERVWYKEGKGKADRGVLEQIRAAQSLVGGKRRG